MREERRHPSRYYYNYNYNYKNYSNLKIEATRLFYLVPIYQATIDTNSFRPARDRTAVFATTRLDQGWAMGKYARCCKTGQYAANESRRERKNQLGMETLECLKNRPGAQRLVFDSTHFGDWWL